MDVTLNLEGVGNTGMQATTLMKEELEGKSLFQQVLFLLKDLFELKDLNESYKGGVSSYVLYLIVSACFIHLKIKPDAAIGQTVLNVIDFIGN